MKIDELERKAKQIVRKSECKEKLTAQQYMGYLFAEIVDNVSQRNTNEGKTFELVNDYIKDFYKVEIEKAIENAELSVSQNTYLSDKKAVVNETTRKIRQRIRLYEELNLNKKLNEEKQNEKEMESLKLPPIAGVDYIFESIYRNKPYYKKARSGKVVTQTDISEIESIAIDFYSQSIVKEKYGLIFDIKHIEEKFNFDIKNQISLLEQQNQTFYKRIESIPELTSVTPRFYYGLLKKMIEEQHEFNLRWDKIFFDNSKIVKDMKYLLQPDKTGDYYAINENDENEIEKVFEYSLDFKNWSER